MLLLLLMAGCEVSTTAEFPTCQVDLVALSPAAASVGQEVTLTATPLTVQWDTAIRVGGIDATPGTVYREGCETCDTCRETEACSVCDADCDACDAECQADCVETTSFVVPELPPGLVSVELYNAHGHSQRLSLEILAPEPVDTGDTGG